MSSKVLKVKVHKVGENQKFVKVLAVGSDPESLRPHCVSLSHHLWSDDLSSIHRDTEDEAVPDWTHIAISADEEEFRKMTERFPTGGDHCECCSRRDTCKLEQLESNSRRSLRHFRDQVYSKMSADAPWLIIDEDPSCGFHDGLYWIKNRSKGSQNPDEGI